MEVTGRIVATGKVIPHPGGRGARHTVDKIWWEGGPLAYISRIYLQAWGSREVCLPWPLKVVGEEGDEFIVCRGDRWQWPYYWLRFWLHRTWQPLKWKLIWTWRIWCA